MRFTIEQRHLTDESGRPLPSDDPRVVTFHTVDAETASEAVTEFVSDQGAELIGNIVTFPGSQAVATMRKSNGVYTLQVTPASSQIVLR